MSSLRSDLSDRADPAGPPEAGEVVAGKVKKSRGEPEGFAAFYAAYPRHEARHKAVLAFPAAVKAAGSLEALMAGLKAFRFHSDHQFVPLPASWLNGKRWLDEPAKTSGPAAVAVEDPRYFDRSPRDVQQLPEPRRGTPEHRAWQRAGDGFPTPLPGSRPVSRTLGAI
ncbi:hypothetical protein RQ734_11650 [Roseomonas mucosa]|uniref:hypothetical protein n=1 Tax=Roseomonas mucosa TaxID=207340 RepID=UPI0028CDD4F2|nr:hypothetical protein [Roseomonas mucosa]MDT8276719.1 hypothetical protein [Roseomonas mucosa]